MALTAEQEAICDWLYERSMRSVLNRGGYPDAVYGDWLPGYLLIAALDPGKEYRAPLLQVYAWDTVQDWWHGMHAAAIAEGLPVDDFLGDADLPEQVA